MSDRLVRLSDEERDRLCLYAGNHGGLAEFLNSLADRYEDGITAEEAGYIADPPHEGTTYQDRHPYVTGYRKLRAFVEPALTTEDADE